MRPDADARGGDVAIVLAREGVAGFAGIVAGKDGRFWSGGGEGGGEESGQEEGWGCELHGFLCGGVGSVKWSFFFEIGCGGCGSKSRYWSRWWKRKLKRRRIMLLLYLQRRFPQHLFPALSLPSCFSQDIDGTMIDHAHGHEEAVICKLTRVIMCIAPGLMHERKPRGVFGVFFGSYNPTKILSPSRGQPIFGNYGG